MPPEFVLALQQEMPFQSAKLQHLKSCAVTDCLQAFIPVKGPEHCQMKMDAVTSKCNICVYSKQFFQCGLGHGSISPWLVSPPYFVEGLCNLKENLDLKARSNFLLAQLFSLSICCISIPFDSPIPTKQRTCRLFCLTEYVVDASHLKLYKVGFFVGFYVFVCFLSVLCVVVFWFFFFSSPQLLNAFIHIGL